MATKVRKQKIVIPELQPVARPAFQVSPLLQSLTVFVFGIAMGAVGIGAAMDWGDEPVVVAQQEELPPAAFGGMPLAEVEVLTSPTSSSSMVVAASSVSSQAAPLLRNRMNIINIARGSVGGTKDAGHIVVDNEGQRAQLWADMATRGVTLPRAAINFNDRMLLALFGGEESAGRHSIEVSHVVMTESDVQVHALETAPGSGCTAAPGTSTPYHIVALDRTNLPLTVVWEKVSIDC